MATHATRPLTVDERIPKRYPTITRKLEYGRIPTGYYMNPDNRFELLPDLEVIYILEQAFDYLEAGNSIRETCEWFNQKTKNSVVHQTITNLYNKHRKPYVRDKNLKRSGPKHNRDTKKLISEQIKARAQIKKVDEARKKIELKKKQIPESELVVPKKEVSSYDIFPNAPLETKVLFKPNPGPQTEFLSAPEEEVLYGGSAGGGKSYAMLADPMRYFHNPNFVGLLIRRTNDELRELKWESMKLYPKAFPGAVWKEKDSMWVFPSGAKFWMTYLERDDDVMRYQGQAFTWIGIDELTQYATPFAWQYLKSRLRTSDPELKKYLCMRATTNPGGPGHHWVKKMFIDPQVPNKPFWATDIETGEVLTYPLNHDDPDKAGKPLFKRRFIPAKLRDNPYLYDDGAYERSLQGLPEAQRRKLLDGDWSVTEGAAFPEFNASVHVVDPFDIPESWRKFRAADYGYASHSAVLWFAIDPQDDTLIVYRELYVSKRTGIELAQMVKEAEREEKVSYGILDSSVWHQRGHTGPSIAEEMIREGCIWRPSDRGQGSRVSGKNRLHELLKVDPFTEQPGIVIFNTCRQLIADLPSIPSDPSGGDDIDDRYRSDHTYDALRYGIMSRPRSGGIDWGNKPLGTYTPANKVFGY